ncbi:uncharacterized protein LOC8061159 [Sorghum bicolor]|uniref:Uncharacterized protein n=1 Tax=Sorghum bicolor TaxID=4558 RepID=A0A1Z5S4H3_SORBI|nr:uncharacterized protein LOC8061159 [Sorghum bicolor]OQU90830.1 hypothetical protein SORBI_3001G054500 [Sorghum bicolor]|eukprot:XP_002466281.2 uncharacterized protein LOC8061159 [Sorghum bicolor]
MDVRSLLLSTTHRPSIMRSSSSTTTVAAAVLVIAVVVLASGGGGVVGVAARPVVGLGQQSRGGASGSRVFVAVELASGTDSSAQPSNCTYGNNVGGVCPPFPPSTPGVGH